MKRMHKFFEKLEKDFSINSRVRNFVEIIHFGYIVCDLLKCSYYL